MAETRIDAKPIISRTELLALSKDIIDKKPVNVDKAVFAREAVKIIVDEEGTVISPPVFGCVQIEPEFICFPVVEATNAKR